ncbi:hypothetical protein P171DRAFT_478929 [Karstenula rhodostoma CBS 690.94]|uniref:Uncharacterized protein n=1 Tax=Karstenula rhodostoma CBS 690.94 TaxID=1392251 RepID=A0A9P4UH80_9PLEO|nr:hypothetical protein P171DRAFT_478929 [Karstenula rhodostoma CBS 690.94]
MSSSAGTKVTDPTASTNESTGLITSDSLAAESLNASGSFAANNPHAAASQQPSASTTSNTTDTSGASRLPPAPDAEARDAQAAWQETSQLNAAQGLGGKSALNGSAESFSPAGGVPVTGGYAGAVEQARGQGEGRPHGTNVTEDPGLTGKSVFGAVGTKQDPSRVAELEFAKRDALPGGATGAGKDLSSQTGDSKFSGLARDESA